VTTPPPQGKVYSALELVEQYGRRVNDRRCGRCGEFGLYEVDYRDERGVVLLCARCDTTPLQGEAA